MTLERRRLWIPGRPIAFARPTHRQTATGRSFGSTPARYRQWRDEAAQAVTLQTRGGPLEGPVLVTLDIYAAGIAAELIAGESLPNDAMRPPGLRGDLDNYAKAALDALQVVAGAPVGALLDDRQVWSMTARFMDSPWPAPAPWND